MRYQYFAPADDLRDFIGSYYIMDVPDGGNDYVRVEIPHVRFLLAGESVLQHHDECVTFRAPDIVLCGPSLRAGYASVSPGSSIFGASILPLGWQALMHRPMHQMANRKILLDEVHDVDPHAMRDQLAHAPNDTAMLAAADDLFRSLLAPRAVNRAFLDAASAWLLDSHSPGVEELSAAVDVSDRQLERLCKHYFGGSPKRLHRKFRALHVCNRLAVTGETDWRQAAGDQFYDQAHFIKEFKELIGCTPGEFIRGKNMMIRFDLEKRLEIPHASGFSLIG